MKYTYKNKKTYKLKYKLRILLTILLAALISTTGYIMSKNAFSDPTDNGILTVDKSSSSTYKIQIRIDGIKWSGIRVYSSSNKLLGTTDSDGLISISSYNYSNPSYIMINGNSINLTSVSTIKYTFSYTIPLVGEAYAEFDSSNGQLRIFRDTAGLYTNGQIIGTKTYYTGIETIAGNTSPKWSSNKENIISVVIEDYFKPKTVFYMFYACRNLTSITGIEKLITSNATSMAYMFAYCGALTSLDVSNFDTRNVTDMKYMFAACSYLTILDVSSFDTSNVMSMDNMFSSCQRLRNLDLSSFNTENVRNMVSMFYSCESLTRLDLSNFYTGNLLSMSDMFRTCPKLVSLDISNFDTSNVEYLSSVFNGCKSLKQLNVSNFDTSSAIDMSYMFTNCNSLESLDVSNFNTSNVTRMDYMFWLCNSITSLDVSSFDTSNVTKMTYMFAGCESLTSLDISGFNTSSVTDMNNMFYTTTNLRVLSLGTNFNFLSSNGLSNSWKRDGSNTIYTAAELTTNYNGSTMAGVYRRTDVTMTAIVYDSGELVFQLGSTPDLSKGNVLGTYTGFDTATYTTANGVPWYSYRTSVTKVTFGTLTEPLSTAYWFYGMINLNKFNNISNLNTSLTTTMQSMFENCTNLLSFNLNNLKTNSLINMNSMFKGCSNLQSLNMSNFKAENLTNVTDLFTNTSLKTLRLGDQNEFNLLPTLLGTWKRDRDIYNTYAGNQVFSAPAGVYRETTTSTVYVIIYDSGEMVFQSDNTPDPTKGNVLFTTSGVESIIVSSTDAIPWYSYRTSVTKVIFTTEVEPIATNCWFNEFSNLSEIENIEYLNTENVTTMNLMFSHCSSLNTLDVSNFDTSNVTTMGSIFRGCSSLTSLDLSSFDTSKVTSMSYVFDSCSSLTTLDLSNFDTSNVTNMYQMFHNCSGLTSLDLSNFDTSKVTSMYYMFTSCSSLTRLNLTNFATGKVLNFQYMFYNCSNLITLDLSSFDTRIGNNMDYMFNGCSSLKTLNISNFDTNKVTSMDYMFYTTTKLSTLMLGRNFKFLSNNKLANSWQRDGDTTIYTADELTNLYNGATMAGTYRVVPEAYAEFDSSNGKLRIFRAAPGTYTNNQVIGTKTYYTGIENITGNTSPKWSSNRANIISVVIEDIFKPKTAYCMFYNCENLTVITGIENLNTSEVTTMRSMFNGCKKLNSLDVSNFNTNNVTTMLSMFNNCKKLANLDVSNFNTNNVTDMEMMFNGCANLLTLDVSNFNTSQVTNMSSMFALGDATVIDYSVSSKLTNLDLSNFDTSKVEDMSFMFHGCTKLNTLDISSFNTSNVTNMNSMFRYCQSITMIDVSDFDTSNVTSMQEMFNLCFEVIDLDVSNFNTSKVTNMFAMFQGCVKLTTVNISNFNTEEVTNMSYMFNGCTNITNFDVSNFDTSNVEAMRSMFSECNKVISLDLSTFDTSKVTDMNEMFYGSAILEELDLSSFDTSIVTDMDNIFLDLPKLNTLSLGTNWNFLSDNGLDKNWLRDGDTTRYTAAELTSVYDGSTMAGTYRVVVQLTITEEVRGNLADINKDFDFVISVEKDGVGIDGIYGALPFIDGEAAFVLNHETQSISLYLPMGYDYIVTQNPDGYTQSKSNDSGTLNADITASFINTLEGTTPTGILIDLIPFIILISCGVLSVLWIRKFKYI